MQQTISYWYVLNWLTTSTLSAGSAEKQAKSNRRKRDRQNALQNNVRTRRWRELPGE
jgi:hypothetical protein